MKLGQLYKSYKDDISGNFAMMFTLMSVPLLIGVGMAIDVSRLQSFESKLQDAVDAAAIYGTVIPDGLNNDDDAVDGEDVNDNSEFIAQVKAHFLLHLNVPDVELTFFNAVPTEEGSVSVTARANIPAQFAQIGPFPRMSAHVSSDADADAGSDLEVVVAFDTTNSMNFDNTWTAAMGTLNNVLTELDQYTGADNFFVSLVPFSDRVNIGTGRDSWLLTTPPSGWNGCVEPREEDNGTVSWALDNDTPVGLERFNASIVGVTGGLAARGGGYPFCANVPITGPTNDVSVITDAADNFVNSGTGRFDVGLAWAWRMLSNSWRTEFPALPNSISLSNKRRKVAIFVTDGRTNAYDYELSADNSWGWNEGSMEGFENMEAVCDGMKADEIEIFMVRINGNTHATSYMQNCASTERHYYEISSNAELELALVEVLKVVKANVRLTN